MNPGPLARTLRRIGVAVAVAALVLPGAPAVAAAPTAPSPSVVSSDVAVARYVVRDPGGDLARARQVAAGAGTVEREVPLIAAVAAELSPAGVELAQAQGMVVTPDATLELHQTDAASSSGVSLDTVRSHVRIDGSATGKGVDIALIDSGVTPVVGMRSARQVVNGPDLSFEAGVDGVRHLDTFGHGTHLAGIINATADATGSAGLAPDARIVSVKVADATGATDVSQVIAAIDWVVHHRRADGLDIRVLALAFGTDGRADAATDPLLAAVEAAWDAGLVVVVAAGNSGQERRGLNHPAVDPLVLSVAAADTGMQVDTSDDSVPAWSSRGDARRSPDVAAPGRSIVSLRVPGSYIDANFGEKARVGQHGFKGSGTSQAAAVTAAMAALILERDPGLTPDQVKHGLVGGARDIAAAPSTADGAGLIDFPGGQHRARKTPESKTRQYVNRSAGTGGLDGARGTHRVRIPVQDADGSIVGWRYLDDFESAFGTTWAGVESVRWTWRGGSWSGASWSGASWSGASWSGASWSGASWSGASWSGASWSGASWSGASWSGASWSSSIWE